MRKSVVVGVSLISTLIAACGGGSGSSPVAAPAPSNTLELSGVAATGAAMAGAKIDVKCATGSGTATTGADGSYKVTIPSGALPCAIKATSADAKTVLHSGIEGSGAGKVNANVTPMTDLVLSEMNGGKPSEAFDQFDANKAKLVTANFDAAKARVRAALSSIADTSNLDPIKDALQAANGTNPGNAHDLQLDKLRDALANAKMELAALRDLLAQNTSGSVNEIVKVTVTPPASACPGFRTGTYRVIEPAAFSRQVFEVTFDAATLKVVSPDGAFNMTANGCTLTAPDGSKVVMAHSGLGVMRTAANTLAFVMPKQSLKPEDIAGNWVFLSREVTTSATSATIGVKWGNISFDNAGKATAAKECTNAGCTDAPAANLPSMSARADGGFSPTGDNNNQRFYGYRAPSGVLSVVAVGADGDVTFARRGPPAEMIALNQVYRRVDIGIGANNVVDTNFVTNEYTVTAVDAANNSFSRRRTSDCRVDTIRLNSPFSQMFDRAAGTYTPCNTGTQNPAQASFSAIVGLSQGGLGIAPYVVPSNNFVGVSISQD